MKRVALLIFVATMTLWGCTHDPKAARDKYFASGQKYLNNKRYAEASIEFRNALRIDKEHVPSYLGLAKASQGMGNNQDAVGAFQQVIKLDSKNVTARLYLGDYLLLSASKNPSLFKKVEEFAEQILEIDPSNIGGLLLRGNAYVGQNDNARAIAEYEKILALDKGNLKALLALGAVHQRNKEMDAAEESFDKALEKFPNSVEAHLGIANFYEAKQQSNDAEKHLRRAFDLAPANPLCLQSLAGFYLSQNKSAEAEGVFKEAIMRKPDDREPRWGLAAFCLRQGRIDNAIAALGDLLNHKKDDWQAQLLLAEIYLGRNDVKQAEERARVVLVGNASNAEAHYLLGRALVAQGETDKALEEFDNALKINGSLVVASLAKSNLQLARADLEGAENTLVTSLQYNRSNPLIRGALAKVLVARQKPQDGIELAQEVLEEIPDNEDALSARGDALRAVWKLNESKKDFQKLCELKPQNASYRHRLGIVEAMLGDTRSGLLDFRRAVELKPDFILAINDLVYMHVKDKQFGAALADLDWLSQLSSPKDEIHRFRGQVLKAKGDLSAAEGELRKAIEINPQNYQSYILLGQLNLKRNNLAQALREVDQLIARNNKLPSAYLLKAYYLQASRDVPGAMANYRKALELDSGNPIAANNLAWLLCESDTHLDEALSLAKVARKKLPEDPQGADTLGWIYYKMKNYTLAIDQLLFSLNNRKKPGAENYYHLGMAYYARGDDLLAKQTLKKSLELSSSFAGADEARKILKLPM